MIFVAAGTKDGRELAGELMQAGHKVAASVVSHYGKELLENYPGISINDKPLDRAGLEYYLKTSGAKLFVDASHPYAAGVSENAIAACRALNIPYIRYERQGTEADEGGEMPEIISATDYEDAAAKAAARGKVIFLTTGSRNVGRFLSSPALKDGGYTVVARILPTAESVAEVLAAGMSPKDIVAAQGPFTREFNHEMFRQYKAEVIITKDSGAVGGTDTKLLAAQDLGLPVVVIARPKIEYGNVTADFAAVIRFAAEYDR